MTVIPIDLWEIKGHNNLLSFYLNSFYYFLGSDLSSNFGKNPAGLYLLLLKNCYYY